MDYLDKKILKILQVNSQIPNHDLAEKIALSPSPCSRRVKKLEDDGYIDKYVAITNQDKLGLSLTIIITVELDDHKSERMQSFQDTIEKIPEILECYLIAGHSSDYILKVVAKDLSEYHSFLLNKLAVIPGVRQVHSSFVLKKIINKTQLPLDKI